MTSLIDPLRELQKIIENTPKEELKRIFDECTAKRIEELGEEEHLRRCEMYAPLERYLLREISEEKK